MESLAREALWRSYSRYDPAKSAAFDTYAARAMQNAVWGALGKTLRGRGLFEKSLVRGVEIDQVILLNAPTDRYFDLGGVVFGLRQGMGFSGGDPEAAFARAEMIVRFLLWRYNSGWGEVSSLYWCSRLNIRDIGLRTKKSRAWVARGINLSFQTLRWVLGESDQKGFFSVLVSVLSGYIGIRKGRSGGFEVGWKGSGNLFFAGGCMPKVLRGGQGASGGSIRAQPPATWEEFKAFYEPYTAPQIVESGWVEEFGLKVPDGMVPRKEVLVQKMFERYQVRYSQAVSPSAEEEATLPDHSEQGEESMVTSIEIGGFEGEKGAEIKGEVVEVSVKPAGAKPKIAGAVGVKGKGAPSVKKPSPPSISGAKSGPPITLERQVALTRAAFVKYLGASVQSETRKGGVRFLFKTPDGASVPLASLGDTAKWGLNFIKFQTAVTLKGIEFSGFHRFEEKHPFAPGGRGAEWRGRSVERFTELVGLVGKVAKEVFSAGGFKTTKSEADGRVKAKPVEDGKKKAPALKK